VTFINETYPNGVRIGILPHCAFIKMAVEKRTTTRFIGATSSALAVHFTRAMNFTSAFTSTRHRLREQLSKHKPTAFVAPPPRMLLGLGIAGCGLQVVKILRSTA
jgi:hypothetical protein